MAIQKSKDPVWLDHKGQKVPREYINAFDVKKESKINVLMRSVHSLNKRLAEVKQKAFEEVDALYLEMLQQANIEPGDRKGNFTLYSFDKSVRIQIDVSDRFEFDEKINFAQEKINQFLQEKTAGSDPELAVLVNNAFQTTKGRLDTKRIFSLFTLKIKHPIWIEAMALIKDSISTNSSVRYLAFYEREEDGDRYHIINLNFSNV